MILAYLSPRNLRALWVSALSVAGRRTLPVLAACGFKSNSSPIRNDEQDSPISNPSKQKFAEQHSCA
jgi:hypothetical protein